MVSSQIHLVSRDRADITANFNWNSIPAGGALKNGKEVALSYIQVAVPANLNDLFVKRTGIGLHITFLFIRMECLSMEFFVEVVQMYSCLY